MRGSTEESVFGMDYIKDASKQFFPRGEFLPLIQPRKLFLVTH